MPTASGHTKAIRASRVIGGKVVSSTGEAFGYVEDIIVDKVTNNIMFAVIGRSGALVATPNFYPLPWSLLDYEKNADAYVIPYERDQLAAAPAVMQISDLTDDDGAAIRDEIYRYYRAAAEGVSGESRW